MASLLRDDTTGIDSAAYEHSYGKELEDWYYENLDANEAFGRTPDAVVKEAYEKGYRRNDGEDFDSWKSRHRLDAFTTNVTKNLEAIRLEQQDQATRQDNLENMSAPVRGLAGGTLKLGAALGGGVPMMLGKLANTVSGEGGNKLGNWLTQKGYDIYSDVSHEASLYPTMDFFDPNQEGFAVNPELKDPSNWGRFALETMGDLAPSMAMGIASFMSGGALAGTTIGANYLSKGLAGKFTKSIAQKALNKGLVGTTEDLIEDGVVKKTAQQLSEEMATKYAQDIVGKRTGAWLGTAILESTGSFAEAVDHMRQKYVAAGVPEEEALFRATDEVSGRLVLTTGAAAAFVEFAGGNMSVLERLAGKKVGVAVRELIGIAQDSRATPGVVGRALNSAKRLMLAAAKNSTFEFGQEFSQEMLNMWNIDFADPDFDLLSPDAIKQAIAAGVAGAVGGFGGEVAGKGFEVSRDLVKGAKPQGPAEGAKILKGMADLQQEILNTKGENPEIRASMEQNLKGLRELQDYTAGEASGVSYADAVKIINEKAPNLTGKNFTTKALRKLVADEANPLKHVTGPDGQEYRGTIDKESLNKFVEMRTGKPAFDPEQPAQAAATTEATAVKPPLVNPSGGDEPKDESAVKVPSKIKFQDIPQGGSGAKAATVPAGSSSPVEAKPADASEDEIEKIHNEIKFDEAGHTYSDGKNELQSVTNSIKGHPDFSFDEEAALLGATAHITDPVKRQEAIEAKKAEFKAKQESGTAEHKEFESIVAGEREGKNPELVSIYDEITDNGRLQAKSERRVAINGTHGGTADVLVKQDDGSYVIYDMKNLDEEPDELDLEQGYYADGPDGKQSKAESHRIQLNVYRRGYEAKGIKISGAKVIARVRGGGYKIIDAAPSEATHRYTDEIFGIKPGKQDVSEGDIPSEVVALAKRVRGKDKQSDEEVAAAIRDTVKQINSESGLDNDPKYTAKSMENFINSKGGSVTRKEFGSKFPDLLPYEIEAVFAVNGWNLKDSELKSDGKPGVVKPRTIKEAPKSSLAVSSIKKFVDMAGLSGYVEVFNGMKTLPSNVIAALGDKSTNNIQGFFYDGKIYINAAMVESIKEVAMVLGHEIIHAAEKPYLNKLIAKLGVGGAVEDWNRLLDRVWKSFEKEATDMHDNQGYSEYYNIKTVEGRRGLAGEVLAEMNTKDRKVEWYHRAIAIIRKLIDRLIVKMGGNGLKVSDSEIRVLLQDMRMAVGEEVAAGNELDALGSPRFKKKAEEEKADAPVVDGGVVKKSVKKTGLPSTEVSTGPNIRLEHIKKRPEPTDSEKAPLAKEKKEVNLPPSEFSEQESLGKFFTKDHTSAHEERAKSFEKRLESYEKNKIARDIESKRMDERQARADKAKAAVEKKAKTAIDMTFIPEDVIAIKKVLGTTKKMVEGLDLKSLREAIQVHSKLRFEWADYIIKAIKAEDFDIFLSGILDAFGYGSVEAAMLSTHASNKVVTPQRYGSSARESVLFAEGNSGMDLMNSAIAEMNEVNKHIEALLDKYKSETIAPQYGDLFDETLSKFRANLRTLYSIKKASEGEEDLASLYNSILEENENAVRKQKKKGDFVSAPGDADLRDPNLRTRNVNDIARMKWYHFPSLSEYFEYAVLSARRDLDKDTDTLRKDLPDEAKDLIARSRAIQMTISFFKGRMRGSHSDALVSAAELQAVEPVDNFASSTVSVSEAEFIGTAFTTIRQSGEKEGDISEIDTKNLDIVRRMFNFAQDIRSAVIHIGNAGSIFGTSASSKSSSDANIIGAAVGPMISVTYDFIMSGVLGGRLNSDRSIADGIFDYKKGEANLLRNYAPGIVENTPGDVDRVLLAVERLGLPTPNLILPLIPKINGQSAIDYYLAKFDEAIGEDENMALLSEDEFIIAMIGIGHATGVKKMIFDVEYMSKEFQEKLIGIGAAIIDVHGNISPLYSFPAASPISRVIRAPLSAAVNYPDNPRMGTFYEGAYVPAKKELDPGTARIGIGDNGEVSSLEISHGSLGRDVETFSNIRSFGPGSILYNQLSNTYFVVGPQIISENGLQKYEIIELSSAAVEDKKTGNVRVYLRDGKRELLTFPQLAQRRLAVVPRVWDVLSGHGTRAMSKDKVSEREAHLQFQDDYRVYDAFRTLTARQMLRDIEVRTGLPVGMANFGHLTRDSNGKPVLAVGAPGGQLIYFRVGMSEQEVAQATDAEAFAKIITAVAGAARKRKFNVLKRQATDLAGQEDAEYLYGRIVETMNLARSVIARLVRENEITLGQAAFARNYLYSLATAIGRIDDGEYDTTMLDVADKVEAAFSNRVGSFDTEKDGEGTTALLLLSALKTLDPKGAIIDLGAMRTFEEEDGLTLAMRNSVDPDILSTFGQDSSENEEGDESFSSNATVKDIGELPEQFVETQAQEYASAIIDSYLSDAEFTESKGLQELRAKYEAMREETRSATQDQHLNDESLKKRIKDRKDLLKLIKERLESEMLAFEEVKKETRQMVENATAITQQLFKNAELNPAFVLQRAKTESGIVVARPKHAASKFSSRLIMILDAMFMRMMTNKDEKSESAIMTMDAFNANMFIGMLLHGGRDLAKNGFPPQQLRLALAVILSKMPIKQKDGSYILFRDASIAQRRAVISILGKAPFLQEILNKQIRLSKLPENFIFSSFSMEDADIQFVDSFGKQKVAKGVPGIRSILESIGEPASEDNPLGLATARGFDAEEFALLVANGWYHPLFGYLATGQSLNSARDSVRELKEAASRVRTFSTNKPSMTIYGEEHVAPDHFSRLINEEIAERFMQSVDKAEDESNEFFKFKEAVDETRKELEEKQEELLRKHGKVPGFGDLKESDRERIKHGDIGHVMDTVDSLSILEKHAGKVDGFRESIRTSFLSIPGVEDDATNPDYVESFVSMDGAKYIKMAYAEMTDNEGHLMLSDLTPSTADMRLVDVMNYIIPGYIKLGDGGISGNPNFRKATKFDGESIIVVPDATYSAFGLEMQRKLADLLDAIRRTPRAFSLAVRNRAQQVVMATLRSVYGKGAEEIIAKLETSLGFGAGEGPSFRFNRSGKRHTLAVDETDAIKTIKRDAELWLSELDTYKNGPKPKILVHEVGKTAAKLLSAMNPVDKEALPRLSRDTNFLLDHAYGFMDKNGDIHIFLGEHVGPDGRVDMAEVMRTVFHEYVGHAGLRRTLGPEYDRIMLMIFDKYCNPSGSVSTLPDSVKIHIAEEYFAGKAEDIKWDSALGRANNRHIGSALDKILSLVIQKFREFAKKHFNYELKITGVEVRDLVRQAFAGSTMTGRTGFSSLLMPGMIPGENLSSFAAYGSYKMNWADKVYAAVGAKLLPFERLERAYESTPNGIPIDELHLGRAERAGHELPYGRRVLFNFMSHFSAFKSRAAEMIKRGSVREKAYAKSFAGKSYESADASKNATAIHALERMFYENSPVFKKKWEETKQRNAAKKGRVIPQSVLDKHWAKRQRKLFDDARLGGMSFEEAVVQLGSAIRAGHIKTIPDYFSTFIAHTVLTYKKSVLASEEAKAAIDAIGAAARPDGEFTGAMVEQMKFLWEASKEMAEVSEQAGLISKTDLEEFNRFFSYPVVIPGTGGRAFRGVGGLSYVGGSRFSYTESGVSINQVVPDAASATFAALRRRQVEAEVNKAVTTLFNFAAYVPLKDVFGLVVSEDIVEEFKRADRTVAGKDRGAIISHMAANGIELMANRADLGNKSMNLMKEQEQREGLIPVYINGNLNYLKIHHKELARAFDLHFKPNRASGIVRGISVVNRWLISMATLLSPEFWLSNLPRDISMALGVLSMQNKVAGKDGLEFAKQSARLIPDAMRYLFAKNFGKSTAHIKNAAMFDKYYDDFKKGGEIQWAFQETSVKTMENLESKIRLAKGKGTKSDHFKNAKETFVEFMQNISGSFENTTRFIVFCTARESGASNDKAVMLARNVTVDFDKKGEYGEVFNTLYMFANAGIQANINIAKMIRNNPGRAAKALGGIVGLSLSFAMMNFLIGGTGDDDEPRYSSIPQETRNANIIVMLPFGDGIPLKMPMAYGLGFAWGIGQELGSFMFGRRSSGQAAAGIMSSLMNNFNPLETAAGLGDVHGWVRMISPTITDPIVDIASEKTPFGTPLMPEETFEGQPDSRRHWRSVSAISKSLARTMNDWSFGSAGESGFVDISPETLDYMFETATGGLGKFVSRIGGIIFSPATGKEITVNDIPGIRRFVGGELKWEARGRFKSNYDQILGAYSTYRELNDAVNMAKAPAVRQQAIEDRNAFLRENKDIIHMREIANTTLGRIKAIDKDKERLYKSGLSDKEIMPKLRVLDQKQIEIFSSFNRRYYETVDNN